MGDECMVFRRTGRRGCSWPGARFPLHPGGTEVGSSLHHVTQGADG